MFFRYSSLPFSFLCWPKCHFLFQTLVSTSSGVGLSAKDWRFSVPSFTHLFVFVGVFFFSFSFSFSFSFAFRTVVCGRCWRLILWLGFSRADAFGPVIIGFRTQPCTAPLPSPEPFPLTMTLLSDQIRPAPASAPAALMKVWITLSSPATATATTELWLSSFLAMILNNESCYPFCLSFFKQGVYEVTLAQKIKY